MKRILLALTLVGLLFPLTPRAGADTDVSLNFFYDNLSPYGSWIDVADYGYCFQPAVAVNNYDWRPYADGYWAYTDFGWTWVSYEDFGWATYHYGRWANLDSFGWVWVPGYEWGPAWVSWRTGGDYVGWAPLPPQGGEVVYEGRAITNQVDVQFGIGPLYYNFVDIRYIGEPVLRGRILPPARNVTIINRTVNVTNITYNNSTVYNYGPDYSRLNQYSTRPVQRLRIQRETNVGANLAQGRKGNFNRVSGDQLTVMAPPIQKSQQRVTPKQVKAKVAKPNLETGWKGVNNRQQVEAEMKQGDPKNIPPPDIQPQKGRQGQTAEARPNEPDRVQGRDSERAGKRQSGERTQQQAQERPQQNQKREAAAQPGNAKDQRAEQREASRAAEAQKSSQGAPQPSDRADHNRDTNAAGNSEASADHSANAENARKDQRSDPDVSTAGEQAREPKPAQTSQDREQAEERQKRQGQRAGQSAPEEAQPGRQADRSQENRASRARQAEDASSGPAAQDKADRGARTAQQANRPDQAQRQTQERRAQQQDRARAQQQQQQQQQARNQPENQQKGKKKKKEDQPPQM